MTGKQYWNNYYSIATAPLIPSQFAAFVCNELPPQATLIDLGCGSGRDSLFFHNNNFKVLGIDQSPQAIKNCNTLITGNQKRNIFLCSSLNDPLLINQIRDNIGLEHYVNLYARFFMHAITDEEELLFFNLAQNLFSNPKSRIFLEFRTHQDESLPKTTTNHFRRFINPVDFMDRCSQYGFKIEYFVEGFGLAKYKTEDAHVCRFILKK